MVESIAKSCETNFYIMLKRKVINELNTWKESSSKKALLIKGARQVGKTTTIRLFGTTHYKNFVEINFEKSPLAKQAFAGNLDAHGKAVKN